MGIALPNVRNRVQLEGCTVLLVLCLLGLLELVDDQKGNYSGLNLSIELYMWGIY